MDGWMDGWIDGWMNSSAGVWSNLQSFPRRHRGQLAWGYARRRALLRWPSVNTTTSSRGHKVKKKGGGNEVTVDNDVEIFEKAHLALFQVLVCCT